MTLPDDADLPELASRVALVLASAGIRAVLTGGACASLYTHGAYQSSDLDFVIRNDIAPSAVDAAMAKLGFQRQGNRYVHPRVRFFVEFLPGPLAIGSDHQIHTVELRIGRTVVSILSPTDSCRDRLAAFYYWHDRQSLRTAIMIALRHEVDLKVIRAWSITERHEASFEEFLAELTRTRGTRKRK